MGGDPHWSKLCCKRAGPWVNCGDRTAALAYAQAATSREDCRLETLSPSESGEGGVLEQPNRVSSGEGSQARWINHQPKPGRQRGRGRGMCAKSDKAKKGRSDGAPARAKTGQSKLGSQAGRSPSDWRIRP